MRVLCVGRHAYLSEHLCRYFQELGAECQSVVGLADVGAVAARMEPHVVVVDCELLTPMLLDLWSAEPHLADTPVLAVSLTRRPEEVGPGLSGAARVIYLPALDREQGLALLAAMHHPRGVQSPPHWRLTPPASAPAVIR